MAIKMQRLLALVDQRKWCDLCRLLVDTPSIARMKVCESPMTALSISLLYYLCSDASAPLFLLSIVANAYPSAITASDGCDTPLHLVCRQRSLERLQVLLAYAQQVDLTVITEIYGNSALHEACRSGVAAPMVQALLQAAPDLAMLRRACGATPLHVAALHGTPVPSVKVIADTYPHTMLALDNYDRTPLHLACRCLSTASADIAVFLLERRPALVRMPDEAGKTPLHVVCATPRAPSALVRHMAKLAAPDILSMRDEFGNTPLHYACHSLLDAETIRFMIAFCPQAATMRNKSSLMPMALACERLVMKASAKAVIDQPLAPNAELVDATWAIVKALLSTTASLCHITTTNEQLHDQANMLFGLILGGAPAAVLAESLEWIDDSVLCCVDDTTGNFPLHCLVQQPWCDMKNTAQLDGIIAFMLESCPAVATIMNAQDQTPLQAALAAKLPFAAGLGRLIDVSASQVAARPFYFVEQVVANGTATTELDDLTAIYTMVRLTPHFVSR